MIKFGTKEDKTFKTGVEGGSFVERNLLGLETYYSLSLNQSFGFLKEDFENAPILFNNQIPKKVLEKLVNENIDFLELIPEDKKSDVITADDLYYYFLEGFAFKFFEVTLIAYFFCFSSSPKYTTLDPPLPICLSLNI